MRHSMILVSPGGHVLLAANAVSTLAGLALPRATHLNPLALSG